ncbi:MAG: MucB/RseB C-terminal domain-containing protein [Sulfuricella sp.]|nr:MucB/RseB C-terminal domain-containing protein [Sulfuricella sp.]
MRVATSLAVAAVLCSATAQANQLDALAWLGKIVTAAHQQSYAGTYIHQVGNRVETFKVVHTRDEWGEHEKLEMLDGMPREVVRNNDEVLCFESDDKNVVVEKRKPRNTFPTLFSGNAAPITENYTVKLGDTGRVSGILCQNVLLDPKDNYRYRHKLCADSSSGILLRISTLNDNGDVVAQTAFTQVTIGGKIDKEQLKPKLTGKKVVIATDRPTLSNIQNVDPNWNVTALPPGFTRTMAFKRNLPGKEQPVSQLVFSDGMASVSVFIEPLSGNAKPMQGLSSQGGINVFAKPVENHQVTVLGEVPSATVTLIGNAVVYNKGKP